MGDTATVKLWSKFLKSSYQSEQKINRFDHLSAEDLTLVEWNGRDCSPLTIEEYLEPQLHPDPNFRKVVKNTHSFADLLAPRLDLGNGNIGLQDLTSVGRMFEVSCGSAEAKSDEVLIRIQERVHQAIASSFPENYGNPWITQWFVQDDVNGLTRTLSKRLKN